MLSLLNHREPVFSGSDDVNWDCEMLHAVVNTTLGCCRMSRYNKN
jgi:hypothetical protein